MDKSKILVKRKLYILLAIAEFISMVAVWPVGMIRRNTVYSSGDAHAYVYTLPLYSGDECTQYFTALGDKLAEHTFSVKCVGELSDDWKLIYKLKDSSGVVLSQKELTRDQILENGLKTVILDVKLVKGEEYQVVLSVEGSEGGIGITCTPYPEDFTPGLIDLYQNGERLGIQSFCQFMYSLKLNTKNVAFTWLFFLLIGCTIVEIILDKAEKKV